MVLKRPIDLYQKIETEYGTGVKNYFESHYKRFLDDCLILWPFGDPEKLRSLMRRSRDLP